MMRRLYVIAFLSLAAASVAHADIKVGSYAWQHKYDGRDYGIPKTNQYGGGYSHLDISWDWTVEQGMQKVNNDWTSVASCLDDNPTNYAGHNSMQSANYMLKKMYPSTWARIKAHSDAGRFDGSDLSWSEGYFAFGGDEYYLRNYYISTRFGMDNFGYVPLMAAGVDLDAPTWTQPKIQNYITGRSTANPTGVGFYNHFTWNWGQSGGLNLPDMIKPNNWNQWRWTSDDGSMVIVGTQGVWSGDGGGAEECVQSAGRFPAFAKKVFQENVWNTSVPNLWNDHLIGAGSGYSLFFWGAKMCENRLLEAEKFGAFARPFGYVYPLCGDGYLYDVWGGFLRFNQHDLADAQGTPWQTGVSNTTNMNVQDGYARALKVADTSLAHSLSLISANVNTTGNGKAVIVYNALSWDRTDYVMVKTADIGFSSPIQVQDASGNVIPSQVIDDRGVSTLVFTAENVPSLGFKVYRAINSAAGSTPAGVTGAAAAGVITLDNQYCTVKVNASTGAITSLYDKVNSKELLSGPGNRIAWKRLSINGPMWPATPKTTALRFWRTTAHSGRFTELAARTICGWCS